MPLAELLLALGDVLESALVTPVETLVTAGAVLESALVAVVETLVTIGAVLESTLVTLVEPLETSDNVLVSALVPLVALVESLPALGDVLLVALGDTLESMLTLVEALVTLGDKLGFTLAPLVELLARTGDIPESALVVAPVDPLVTLGAVLELALVTVVEPMEASGDVLESALVKLVALVESLPALGDTLESMLTLVEPLEAIGDVLESALMPLVAPVELLPLVDPLVTLGDVLELALVVASVAPLVTLGGVLESALVALGDVFASALVPSVEMLVMPRVMVGLEAVPEGFVTATLVDVSDVVSLELDGMAFAEELVMFVGAEEETEVSLLTETSGEVIPPLVVGMPEDVVPDEPTALVASLDFSDEPAALVEVKIVLNTDTSEDIGELLELSDGEAGGFTGVTFGTTAGWLGVNKGAGVESPLPISGTGDVPSAGAQVVVTCTEPGPTGNAPGTVVAEKVTVASDDGNV